MRSLAVVEARMGSSRFPGKVLAPLAGMPVLEHVCSRLASCAMLEKVVIATSTLSRDDVLAEAGLKMGVDVVRGPEDNLLARHLLVLEQYAPDVVVRITGDCPLVDPDVIERLLVLMADTGADYATVRDGTPCIHQGIDPYRATVLHRLAKEHGQDPCVQEHVVSWLKGHPEFASISYLEIPEQEQFAGARISVDTPADLTFLESVYESLGAEPGKADIREVADLLRAEPWLMDINKHVQQKAIGAGTRYIVVRGAFSASEALQHPLAKILAALRDVHGIGVRLVAEPETVVKSQLLSFGCVDDPLEVQPCLVLDVSAEMVPLANIPAVHMRECSEGIQIVPCVEMGQPFVLEGQDIGQIYKAASILAGCVRNQGGNQC